MTLKLSDFNRLRAFMARTTSASDPEALTAIRMANALLATHNLTWDKVFSRTVKVIDSVDAAPAEPPYLKDPSRDEISRLIAEASDNADARENEWETEFVADVGRQFASGRDLTQAQIDKLREIRDR